MFNQSEEKFVKCNKCKRILCKEDAQVVIQKEQSYDWNHNTTSMYVWDEEELYFCPEDSTDWDLKEIDRFGRVKLYEDVGSPYRLIEEKEAEYKCDKCDFRTDSKRGVAIHRGAMHK